MMKILLGFLAVGLAGCASIQGQRFAKTAPLKPVYVVSQQATRVIVRKEPMGIAVSEVPIQTVGNQRPQVASHSSAGNSKSDLNPPACRRFAP